MNPRVVVLAVGLLTIVALVLVAGGRIGPLELVVLLAILAGVAAFFGNGGEVLRFETSASPEEVINAAITAVGTHRRWSTLAHMGGTATFAYHRPPSKLVAFLLLLCFLVPGVVYIVLAGKRESLSIAARPERERTAVQVTSNGWRGRRAGRALENELGQIISEPGPAPAAELGPS